MRLLAGPVALGSWLLFAAAAYAQTPPSDPPASTPEATIPPPTPESTPTPTPPGQPTPPPVTATVSPPGAALWHASYTQAREELARGRFAEAAAHFDHLARTAPGPSELALALELRDLARSWADRRLVLARAEDVAEGAISGKAVNERTTDELVSLYGTSLVYGIGGGVWIGTLAKADTAAGYILPAFGVAAAAAGGVYALDNIGPRHLRYGVGQSIVTGAYLGTGEGALWTLWNHVALTRRDEWEPEASASVVFAAATTGAIVGGAIGSAAGATPGRAAMVGSGGMWTSALSGLVAGSLTPESDREYRDDNALLTAAISLNGGIVLGALLGATLSPSLARVRFIDLGGVAGGLLAGGTYWAAADDETEAQPWMAVTAGGTAAGLALAAVLTSGMTPDRPVADDAPALAHASIGFAPAPGGAQLSASGQF